MYELEYPAPDVHDGPGDPTLIVALHGYADAGNAIYASSTHLLDALEHTKLATFHNDELIDYRSRRPTAFIDANQVVDIDPMDIGVDLLRDINNRPFLLLSGPEPDMRWEAFSDSVLKLVKDFDIKQTICLYSAPMAVPHTRPLVITAHGNEPALLKDYYTLDAKISLPGAAQLHIEHTLSTNNHTVTGLTAHVPHYVANADYPQATLSLLQALERSAQLTLPLGTIEQDVEKASIQLAEHTDTTPEVQHVVAALEQQYDEEMSRYNERKQAAQIEGGLPANSEDLPSGDDIAAAFENYLEDYLPEDSTDLPPQEDTEPDD